MSKRPAVQGIESIDKSNSPQLNHHTDAAYGMEHMHESVGVPNCASDPGHVAASKKVTDRAKARYGKSVSTSSSTSKKVGSGAYGEK